MIGALRYFAARMFTGWYWPKGSEPDAAEPVVTAISGSYQGPIAVHGAHDTVFLVGGWQGPIAVSGCVEEG